MISHIKYPKWKFFTKAADGSQTVPYGDYWIDDTIHTLMVGLSSNLKNQIMNATRGKTAVAEIGRISQPEGEFIILAGYMSTRKNLNE